ncbi:MAG: hypothetical protein WBZ36_01560 [Candidatus Nitrosopolaris sp.]
MIGELLTRLSVCDVNKDMVILVIHNVNISVEVDGYVDAQIKFPNNM